MTVADLLDKPFSYGNKVELKTKTSNGAVRCPRCTVRAMPRAFYYEQGLAAVGFHRFRAKFALR